MSNSFSFNRFKLKDIRLFSLILGGCYAGFGAFSSFIVLMQKWTFSKFEEFPDDAFMETMLIMHDIWLTYMPWLVLIGIGYVAFGLSLKQLGKLRFHANLVLGIASLAWAICYSIGSMAYFESFNSLLKDMPMMDQMPFDFAEISNTSAIFGFISVGAMLVLPQAFIGIWTVKYVPAENEV